MPFGIIGRTGPGMRQVLGLAGFGDRSTGRGTFEGEFMGRAIVTNGDFTAYMCDATLFPEFFGHTCYPTS